MYLSCRYHSPYVGCHLPKTQLAGWCVGATAGTMMTTVMMAAKQNQAQSAVIQSRMRTPTLLRMPEEMSTPLYRPNSRFCVS